MARQQAFSGRLDENPHTFLAENAHAMMAGHFLAVAINVTGAAANAAASAVRRKNLAAGGRLLMVFLQVAD
jgi:hypothetical protein